MCEFKEKEDIQVCYLLFVDIDINVDFVELYVVYYSMYYLFDPKNQNE